MPGILGGSSVDVVVVGVGAEEAVGDGVDVHGCSVVVVVVMLAIDACGEDSVVVVVVVVRWTIS